MDKLLLIDDEADVQYSFRRIFDTPETQVIGAISGEEGLKLLSKVHPDVVLLDIRLGGISGLETLRRIRQTDARLPVIMMTAYGTTRTAIEAMKLGAFDYLLKPFEVDRLRQVVATALKAARDMRHVVSYQPLLTSEDHAVGIIGRSDVMQEVFKTIGQVAASDTTVLITGESGTGKELVARAIYHHTRRSHQPFLALNCAAIPENLLESELFGHERGAFTGAVAQRIGRFEQCHRGTLFLDEIGEMSTATQAKILRVLQSGTFERVGGSQTVNVDVRVIAATNKALDEAVARHEFREDLFYRLNVVRIHLPPLRQRAEDIPLLVDYFLKKTGSSTLGRRVRTVSPEALALLQGHAWPGNVRELENAIQRAAVLAKGEVVSPADLPPEILPQGPVLEKQPCRALGVGTSDARVQGDPAALARDLFTWARANPQGKLIPVVERELIRQALLETAGNQVRAARLLGITRATLRKRIAKYQIRREFDAR